MTNHDNINWLTDDVYQKLIGQLRLQMLGIFEPFKQYGQDVYIAQSAAEGIKL